MLKIRKHIYWYFKLYFCMKKLIIKLFEYIPCSDWIFNKYLLFKGRQRKVCLGSKNADTRNANSNGMRRTVSLLLMITAL